MAIPAVTIPDAEVASSPGQSHLEEVLDTGVKTTNVDGQTVNFQNPTDVRKRVRELEQQNGTQRRPIVRRFNLGGF